jgi:hypothetical protein
MTIVNLSNGDGSQKSPAITTTDVLIIGTGPAGASLACFLASYGWFHIPKFREKPGIKFLSLARNPRHYGELLPNERGYSEGPHHQHGCHG